MNPDAKISHVEEINRLHAVVQRCNADSRTALNAALTAAWHAGQLLLAERERVNAIMLRGAWCGWLRKNFRGSLRTAHRYVRLAQSLSDVTFLGGLSLRQAYFRLGIATEPKKCGHHSVPPLPDYVRLATRLRYAQALGEDAANSGAGVRRNDGTDNLPIDQPPELFSDEVTRRLLGQHSKETPVLAEWHHR